MPFAEKIPKAIWRGALLNEQRKALMTATEGKNWSDVEAVKWEPGQTFIPIADHCKYQFVIHTEGKKNHH